jgi:hypothetical protein
MECRKWLNFDCHNPNSRPELEEERILLEGKKGIKLIKFDAILQHWKWKWPRATSNVDYGDWTATTIEFAKFTNFPFSLFLINVFMPFLAKILFLFRLTAGGHNHQQNGQSKNNLLLAGGEFVIGKENREEREQNANLIDGQFDASSQWEQRRNSFSSNIVVGMVQ